MKRFLIFALLGPVLAIAVFAGFSLATIGFVLMPSQSMILMMLARHFVSAVVPAIFLALLDWFLAARLSVLPLHTDPPPRRGSGDIGDVEYQANDCAKYDRRNPKAGLVAHITGMRRHLVPAYLGEKLAIVPILGRLRNVGLDS